MGFNLTQIYIPSISHRHGSFHAYSACACLAHVFLLRIHLSPTCISSPLASLLHMRLYSVAQLSFSSALVVSTRLLSAFFQHGAPYRKTHVFLLSMHSTDSRFFRCVAIPRIFYMLCDRLRCFTTILDLLMRLHATRICFTFTRVHQWLLFSVAQYSYIIQQACVDLLRSLHTYIYAHPKTFSECSLMSRRYPQSSTLRDGCCFSLSMFCSFATRENVIT